MCSMWATLAHRLRTELARVAGWYQSEDAAENVVRVRHDIASQAVLTRAELPTSGPCQSKENENGSTEPNHVLIR
jgi:hypothetical protein